MNSSNVFSKVDILNIWKCKHVRVKKIYCNQKIHLEYVLFNYLMGTIKNNEGPLII